MKRIMLLFLLLFLTGCFPAREETVLPIKNNSTTSTGAASLSLPKPTAASKETVIGTNPASTSPAGTVPETKPSLKPDSQFTLVISGDVMSHDHNWKAAQQADGSFDYMPLFQNIRHLLDSGDLTLVNHETPVSGEEYGYSGSPLFNAPFNLSETLKKVGVDLAITANNHVLDNGMDGMRSFLDNLEEAGLLHTGAARTPEEQERPYLLDINGIKTGFATSTSLVTMKVPEKYAVPINNEDVMRQQIQDLRKAGAELIVYHIHWGKEYTEYPSRVQMDLYEILKSEGVDIVIGSHPHRLQPMEIRPIEYEGKTKDQAVIWSTANMTWGSGWDVHDYVNTGAIFRIDVARVDDEILIQNMDYDLIYNLNTATIDGVKHIELVPESDMELYKESHPDEYASMRREFKWAHETLSTPVVIP